MSFPLYSGRNIDESWYQVYRVNWLRAKARYDRWNEELELVPNEMKWTVGTFSYQEQRWKRRAESCQNNHTIGGTYGYALKQADMWRGWKEKADLAFAEAIAK